ncbi:hypothetical protein Veis_2557 [Verminephrobacter eiseniae EF01-2]|uniref:Uncharacterized protein n=1 Tax=Verminephrobacter eiseniae (strain EF01-2) TaxID=391735 RepID=A1WKZ5_VEREI|nr:hypothetical protein Veis_2557 [Verminephrobacter eiseniae EF01-2]
MAKMTLWRLVPVELPGCHRCHRCVRWRGHDISSPIPMPMPLRPGCFAALQVAALPRPGVSGLEGGASGLARPLARRPWHGVVRSRLGTAGDAGCDEKLR